MKQRAKQVSEEIRKIISSYILENMNDIARFGLITITRIEATDDLRFARVYYSVLGDDKVHKNVQQVLEEKTGYIRALVSRELPMKFSIELRFVYDDLIEESFKVDQLLKKIHENDERMHNQGEAPAE